MLHLQKPSIVIGNTGSVRDGRHTVHGDRFGVDKFVGSLGHSQGRGKCLAIDFNKNVANLHAASK